MAWLAALLWLAAYPASAQQGAGSLAEARFLFSAGRYREAVEPFTRAVAAGQAAPADRGLLAICYVRLGRQEEAAAVLSEARRLSPQDPIVLFASGVLAFAGQRFQEAYADFQAALRGNPALRDARDGMAAAAVNLGVQRYRERDIDGARRFFRDALEADPASFEALKNLAVLELEAGNPDEAAGYAQAALKERPEDPAALELAVRALRASGQEGKLEALLRRLQERHPSAGAAAALGRLLQRHGDRKGAEQAFQEAAKLGSSDPYPYLFLGRAAASRGEAQRAVSLLDSAAAMAVELEGQVELQAARRLQEAGGKLGPEELRALKELSGRAEAPRAVLKEALDRLGELLPPERFEENLRLLSRRYPHSRALAERLGDALLSRGAFEEAAAVWRRLAEEYPTDARAHLGLARAAEGSGQLTRAILECRRAMELSPREEAPYLELEKLYGLLGGQAELRDILKDRLHVDTVNPVLLRALARVERSLGEQEAADRHEAEARSLEEAR